MIVVDSHHLPRTPVTIILIVVMIVIYLVDPPITPVTYTVLAPWMHAGFTHLSQNLLVFLILGTWNEHRMGWPTYLFGAVMIPYLALYLPVVLGYGELSRGASGLTMALTGYAVPVLLLAIADRFDEFDLDPRQVAVWLGMFLLLAYLAVDSWLTIQRFVGLAPRPDGVSVASHFTGLALGLLWFCWRTWRHGIWNA